MKLLLLFLMLVGCAHVEQIRIEACEETVNHLSEMYDREGDTQFCQYYFKRED